MRYYLRWYNALPDDIKAEYPTLQKDLVNAAKMNAIINPAGYYAFFKHDGTLSGQLQTAFSWHRTPRGCRYWGNLRDKLKDRGL